MIRYEKRKFTMVTMDASTLCNARCVFCFNEWDQIPKQQMSIETFEKITQLFPMIPEHGFYLSCLYEPTVSNHFFDFLKRIPKEHAERVFFTTNLVRKLTYKELWAMAYANVSHINISLETYRTETYQKLTGVRQSFFYENLKKLSRLCRMSRKRIRIITMLLNSNYDEVEELVKRVHHEVAPFEHEIRTPFLKKTDGSFHPIAVDELLTKREVEDMQARLQGLGYDNFLFGLTSNKESYQEEKERMSELTSKVGGTDKREVSLSVRIEPDGLVHFGGTKIYFNINEIEDVPHFFAQQLVELQCKEALWYLEETVLQGQVKTVEKSSSRYAIDGATMFDGRFLYIRGWEGFSLGAEKRSLSICQADGESKQFRVKTVLRPDVVNALNDERYLESGFETRIDLGTLESRESIVLSILRFGQDDIEELPFMKLVYRDNKWEEADL